MASLSAPRAAGRRLLPGLAACLLCAACGAGGSAGTSQARGATVPASSASQSRSATASGDGLKVTLTLSPARAAAGAPVSFRLAMGASSAAGALAYRIRFGDGSGRQNIVPEFCRAPPGGPGHGSWQISHRYARAGTYRVTLFGSVNCQRASRVAVTVDVVIT